MLRTVSSYSTIPFWNGMSNVNLALIGTFPVWWVAHTVALSTISPAFASHNFLCSCKRKILALPSSTLQIVHHECKCISLSAYFQYLSEVIMLGLLDHFYLEPLLHYSVLQNATIGHIYVIFLLNYITNESRYCLITILPNVRLVYFDAITVPTWLLAEFYSRISPRHISSSNLLTASRSPSHQLSLLSYWEVVDVGFFLFCKVETVLVVKSIIIIFHSPPKLHSTVC